jgi:dethiobiotin synthetase
MRKGFFVTATGTDVGKTYVTALLVKKLRESGCNAGYYKAALSGAQWKDGVLVPGDADYVRTVAGLTDRYDEMVSYVYEAAVSPHLAAQMEGNPVALSKVKADFDSACQRYDFVVAEGSGGIVCPIRWDDEQHLLLEDVIETVDLPLVIVANGALGTINSVVLTVEYAKARSLPILGIVLNQFHKGDRMEEDNRKMIETLTGVPVLAVVGENEQDLEIDVSRLTGSLE